MQKSNDSSAWRRRAKELVHITRQTGILPPLVLVGILLFYDFLMSHFFSIRQVATEVPLIIGLYCLLLMPLRSTRWCAIAAALPLYEAYLVHDVYYAVFRTPPDFVDLSHVFELRYAFGNVTFGIIVAIAFLPVLAWILSWRFLRFSYSARAPFRLRQHPLWQFVTAAGTFLVLTTAMLFPRAAATEARSFAPPCGKWDPATDVARYGRLFMAFVRETERRSWTQEFAEFGTPERTGLALPATVREALQPRNIYIIVMESFIDPRNFVGVHYSISPMSPEFDALFDKAFNVSISPVLGGDTERAEFEVMCGVPSLKLIDMGESFAFTGASADCLPNLLRHAKGYHTILGFPGSPKFFNSRRFYKGMGFEELLFADKESPPGTPSIVTNSEGNGHLFDSFLYDQMLTRVDDLRRREPGRPVLTYILTLYGHTPYKIDPQLQPLIVHVEPKNDAFERMANMAYYRSKALYDLFDRLRRTDPTAIVIAVGDHLPPLSVPTYRVLDYQGRVFGRQERALKETALFIMDRGLVRSLPPIRHYNIPAIILDSLSNGAFCRALPQRCSFDAAKNKANERKTNFAAYCTIMGEASRPE
jgi:hypothetical protein